MPTHRLRPPATAPGPDAAHLALEVKAKAEALGDDDDSGSTTQQDEIYTQLRHWITIGRFLPGQRLKIRQVAGEMAVGLMPVRAALQRLAAEGALVNNPNAGVAVPRLSVPEFDDLLQMRMLLEGEAAERGCLRLEPAQLTLMKAWGQTMDLALATCQQAAGEADKRLLRGHSSDDDASTDRHAPAGGLHSGGLHSGVLRSYLAAHGDFHLCLYRATASPLLLHLIGTLWLKAGPISTRLFDLPEATDALNSTHHDTLRALERRDSAATRRAVERGLFVAGQLLRRACGQPG